MLLKEKSVDFISVATWLHTQGISNFFCGVQVNTDQVTGLGGRDEGIMSRMATGYFSRRSETCRQALNLLQEYGLVMMRAPPGSGKPSLCQLVTIVARASSMFQQVFYFS